MSWFHSVLSPLEAAISHVLVVAHSMLTALGAPPDAGLTWTASIALLVVAVRIALLPLVVRGVRLAHANARVHPELARIKERYRGRTDRASRLEAVEKLRAARAEHGVGSLGWLPLLLQLPLALALFRLLIDVARGVPIGAMTAALVASAGAASLFGARLAASAQLGWGLPTLTVGALTIGAVIAATAAMTYLGSRLAIANLPTVILEGPVGAVQRVMPAASAIGICISAFALPLGVIVYWLVSATWTVGQQLVINRVAPTPGSAAAASG